jgi:hypothetical protein
MPLDKKRVREPIEELLCQLARFLLPRRVWAQAIDSDGEFVTGQTADN